MIRRSLLSALLVLGSAVPAADALWQNNLDTEAELRQFSRHASDWDLKGGTGGFRCVLDPSETGTRRSSASRARKETGPLERRM